MSSRAPSVRDPARPTGPRVDDVRLRDALGTHYQLVWRTLRRLGVAQAALDDAAQQVFIVLSNRLEQVEPGKERAFLLSSAFRVASNTRRGDARRREDPLELAVTVADLRPNAEELLDQKRARALLDRALDALPLDLRTVFALFELEGMTMAEIAEAVGVPPGTVASRLRRARAKFEEELQHIRSQLGLGGEP